MSPRTRPEWPIARDGFSYRLKTMPELAEVEFFRRQWEVGIGKRVERVHVHATARIYRSVGARVVVEALTGTSLQHSEAQAKQMLFRFDNDRWLGIHLGMSGSLIAAAPEMVPGKHDHLVLYLADCALIFSDPRMFGKVALHRGVDVPGWWAALPAPILSSGFTESAVGDFCARRPRSSIKAVLLMQERFPGIGNWMADEILWRAGIHPRCPAGKLASGTRRTALYTAIREVTADALREIAGVGTAAVPRHLSAQLPDHWLFNHRWKDGGTCPRSGTALVRETIAGRTTCYCPKCQSWSWE